MSGESEHGEAGEVDGGGEQSEVGCDLGFAAHAGAAAAVAAAHQVGDLALDLRAGGLVVGLPGRIGLALASAGELLLVGTDLDRAAVFGGGAPFGQRAARAGLAEVRDLSLARRSERHGVPGGAGDRARVEVDLERVL